MKLSVPAHESLRLPVTKGKREGGVAVFMMGTSPGNHKQRFQARSVRRSIFNYVFMERDAT